MTTKRKPTTKKAAPPRKRVKTGIVSMSEPGPIERGLSFLVEPLAILFFFVAACILFGVVTSWVFER